MHIQLYEYSWITIKKTDKRFLLFFRTHFVKNKYTVIHPILRAVSLFLHLFFFFLAPLVICVVIFLSLAFHLRD